MRKLTPRVVILLAPILSLIAACGWLSPSAVTPEPTVTLTASPTATPTLNPTQTALPLSQRVKLASVHTDESGQSPNYTITAETPVILDIDDPRAENFNSLASGIVTHDINEFKASLKYLPGTPVSSGSFLDITWKQLSSPGEILSLKYDIMGYAEGAAHPYQYSQTLTFNIDSGEQVSLEQLFLPDSDFLTLIADICKSDLSKRDIAFDPSSGGADPTAENYRNWNITPDGLLITFDEYQVAAYAAGPQTVTIPYASLQAIIDPDGPLARMIQ